MWGESIGRILYAGSPTGSHSSRRDIAAALVPSTRMLGRAALYTSKGVRMPI